MSENVTVRRATHSDLQRIALINSSVFLGDRDSVSSALEWITCWFQAFPLYQYFIVEVEGEVAGYAGWQLHGGFLRSEPVIELDQIGIDTKYQGRKLAPHLMNECMQALAQWIQEKNNRIESHISFLVWGYALNFNAISIYAKQFGEGVCGFRTQFGSRAENMLRHRLPIIRPVRED